MAKTPITGLTPREIERQSALAFKEIESTLEQVGAKTDATASGASVFAVSQALRTLQAQFALLRDLVIQISNRPAAEQTPIIEEYPVLGQMQAYEAVYLSGAANGGANFVSLVSQFPAALDNGQLALGITVSRPLNGRVRVLTFGNLEYLSWDWEPGLPIYVGADGLLTQDEPAVDEPKLIGYAITATRIRVEPNYKGGSSDAVESRYEVFEDEAITVTAGRNLITVNGIYNGGAIFNNGAVVPVEGL